MFVDARELPDGSSIEVDLCIVGAGPAGITMARDLARAGIDVCMLESGGVDHDDATQALSRGSNVGYPYYDLDLVQVRRFGGAGNVWSGACRPLDEIDFARRPELPLSGWPFGKADLDPFYARAHELLELGPYRYDPADLELPDSRRLPIADERVETAMYRASPVRFGARFKDEVAEASRITVYLHANVVEIEANADRSAVTGLRVATLSGLEHRVRARTFILATGAIENARLMLASKLGNDRDLVGRFFMEHLSVPSAVVMTSDADIDTGVYAARLIDGVFGVGYLTIGPQMLEEEGLPNIRAFVSDTTPDEAARKSSEGVASAGFMWNAVMSGQGLGTVSRHLGGLIRDVDGVLLYGYYRAFRPMDGVLTLVSHIEQTPDPESRVTLDEERDPLGTPRVKLAWRFGELERRSMRRAMELFAQGLGASGLGRVRVLEDGREGWPPGVRGSWHQMGTTRMDTDPTRGVVDENCRVHGMANLYVAGSSVFPTAGYTNPTLTIVALAHRLADHLAAGDRS